jgi:hypothetical protein
VDSIAVEEFVEGHEGFYDTLSVDGRPALDFASHHFPNVLEAMRTRWISPQCLATNRIDSVADYQQVRDLGLRVNEVLVPPHQRLAGRGSAACSAPGARRKEGPGGRLYGISTVPGTRGPSRIIAQ